MKKNYLIIVLLAFCLSISVAYQYYFVTDNMYENIVDSDGKGYYAFLPAVFIYHDLSFNFFFEKKNRAVKRYFHERFIVKQGDRSVIKTYCGEAVLLTPFFLTGWLTQFIIHGEANGYEGLMQFFICLGVLFYLALGLFYLKKFLRYYYIEQRIIHFALAVFVLGTNLLYYAVYHPTMTHVYSFSLIAIFLYSVKSFWLTESKKYLFSSALLLGLITLLRPVNLVVILIVPFLSSEWSRNFISEKIKNHAIKILVAVFIFTSVVSLQLLLNFLQCGRLFPWSYGDEGFYFLHPRYFDVLFSFRNGLFIYTPMALLACFGFYYIFKKQRQLFYGLIITLLVSYYFISSWWSWYYGGGFGHRASIDWYAFFIIPFAFLLNNVNRMAERVIKIICVLLVTFNLFQTWQYLIGIIHPEGMTKEKYAYVFLHGTDDYIRCLGDGVEETFLPPLPVPFYSTENDLEKPAEKWRNNVTTVINGNTSGVLNDTLEYGPTLVVNADKPEFFKPFFVKVYADRYENEFKACTKNVIIIDYVNTDGEIYNSKNLRINDLPNNPLHQWKTFAYDFPMPPVKSKDDVIKVFVWNYERKSFLVDNIKVSFYNYADKPSKR